ncbi:MAG: hypothetical protein R2780_09295 [Crocinitomicaceae bacterium]
MYATSVANGMQPVSPDGALDMTIFGSDMPYSFLWSNGDTLQDLDSVVAGMYSVVITDTNGCMLIYQDSIALTNYLSQPYNTQGTML